MGYSENLEVRIWKSCVERDGIMRQEYNGGKYCGLKAVKTCPYLCREKTIIESEAVYLGCNYPQTVKVTIK